MSERAIWLVVLLIGPVTCFLIGPYLGNAKMKAQRKQQTDDSIVKYAPMPRTFFSDDTWRPMSQAHFSFGMSEWVEKLIPDGSRINEDCTNTNIVNVSSLKGGIWTEADNIVGALLPKQEKSE
jgi:hypothetical protein